MEYGHRLGPLVGPYVELEEHVALRLRARARGVDGLDGLITARSLGCADVEQVRARWHLLQLKL